MTVDEHPPCLASELIVASSSPSDSQLAPSESDGRYPTVEELIAVADEQPEPGHDAWVRRQVQKALDDKKAGKANYKDFDEVAARFGFKRP